MVHDLHEHHHALRQRQRRSIVEAVVLREHSADTHDLDLARDQRRILDAVHEERGEEGGEHGRILLRDQRRGRLHAVEHGQQRQDVQRGLLHRARGVSLRVTPRPKSDGSDLDELAHNRGEEGLEHGQRQHGDHGGEQLQTVDARGAVGAERVEEVEEDGDAVVVHEQRGVLRQVDLAVRERGEPCGEEEHERRLVALLLPVVAAEDGVEERDEDGTDGGLRVQHLRVTRRRHRHETEQLEDVGHVLDDAAIQVLNGMRRRQHVRPALTASDSPRSRRTAPG